MSRFTPITVAVLAVLAQIAYPLTPRHRLTPLIVITVLAFAFADLTHAWRTRGRRWTVSFAAVILVGALVVEIIGVATGVPFGSYSYAHTLGARLAGVPVLVPLAWLMMSYPCLLLGRALAGSAGGPARAFRVALAGGWTLAAWDVFLDPQLVAAHAWHWAHPRPGLPGTAGVPLTNLVGWLVAGTVVIAVADRIVPKAAEDAAGRCQLLPAALLAWTWLGSALGNAAFFGRGWVALWGLVLMGVTVVPYLRNLLPRKGFAVIRALR